MLVRWIAAAVGFVVVVAVGIVMAGGIPQAGEADPVTFAFQAVADVLALVLGVALLIGIAIYLVLERIQTGTNASVTRSGRSRAPMRATGSWRYAPSIPSACWWKPT